MRKIFKMAMMLFVLISFLALPGVGFAEEYKTEEVKKEDEKTKEEVQKLEEIVVQARKIEESISAEKLSEVGHHIEIITSEEIEEAGFVDIVKAVEAMVPGLFSYARSGRAGWKRTVLHGSDKILWLLDGVRINSIGSGGRAMTLSVHMIDRIEVLKGGESLFYGSDARAGVINVITKKITRETSGEFGMTYGDNEYREVYGHVTGTVDSHGLMVFGSQDASDGYVTCDDQAYRDALNTDAKKSDAFDRSTLGIKYRKEFDLAGKSVLNAQLQKQKGYFDYPYPWLRKMDNSWEDVMGIVKWDHDINDTFSYYIKSYCHTWWGVIDQVELDGSVSKDQREWGTEDYGVNLMTSTRWGEGHEILSGIDYHNYWGKDEYGVKGNRWDRGHLYGFFANYRPYLPFSPDTMLAMGARYTTTGEEDSTIWTVSMKTPIVGQTYFRGIVGTSFSPPTASQLYGHNPERNRFGNPDLKPMESLNVEVGAGGSWRYFQCDVGYFSQDVKDNIQGVTLPDGVRTYKNVDGTTEIEGVEVSAGIGPFRGLSFNVSATWVDAEDKDTGEQLERNPKFYGKANVGYRHPTDRFGADLITRYTGDIYERGLGTPDEVNYGNYYIANASAFVKFGREKRHRVTLRVENIFDKEYATRYNRSRNIDGDYFVYNHYGLPRSLVVGYTYTF
jgi:vitamin B12 transporter